MWGWPTSLLHGLRLSKSEDAGQRLALGLVRHDLQLADHVGHVGQPVDPQINERTGYLLFQIHLLISIRIVMIVAYADYGWLRRHLVRSEQKKTLEEGYSPVYTS